MIIRPRVKQRKIDQNSAMWAGLYKDLTEQVWIDGKQYSQEVWHEYCKQQFLPEDDNPELPLLVTRHETWRKWDYLPDGGRRLCGTTTRLTPRGMSDYMMQIEAMGSEYGVLFQAFPRMQGMVE